MTESINNPNEPRKLNDAELDEVSGGQISLPKEFRDLLSMVQNADVKRYINKEINKGDIDTAYRHLYQTLRLDGYLDLAQRVKQLYADTHDGSGIPGLL